MFFRSPLRICLYVRIANRYVVVRHSVVLLWIIIYADTCNVFEGVLCVYINDNDTDDDIM